MSAIFPFVFNAMRDQVRHRQLANATALKKQRTVKKKFFCFFRKQCRLFANNYKRWNMRLTERTTQAVSDGDGDDADDTIEYQVLIDKANALNRVPDPVPELSTMFADSDESESSSANVSALRTLKHAPIAVPDLTRFPAAIDVSADGVRRFLPSINDIIVHNLFASEDVLIGRPYLRTTKGRVQEIREDGLVWLWDIERQHSCCLNWLTEDPKNVRWPGARARDAEADMIAAAEAALADGRIDEAEEFLAKAKRMGARAESAGEGAVAKKRTGRPRKVLTAEEQARRDDYLARKAAGTVHRGRPKGSKNRDADTVAEEKKKLRRDRKERRVARANKQRQRTAR